MFFPFGISFRRLFYHCLQVRGPRCAILFPSHLFYSSTESRLWLSSDLAQKLRSHDHSPKYFIFDGRLCHNRRALVHTPQSICAECLGRCTKSLAMIDTTTQGYPLQVTWSASSLSERPRERRLMALGSSVLGKNRGVSSPSELHGITFRGTYGGWTDRIVGMENFVATTSLSSSNGILVFESLRAQGY